ncbi:MAG TPA: hypothetical protein PK879_04160 [Opitutaceae bacterium]|jgi:hypothetical protein|nr:hypothetical protein [Opitutaceae bacterium]OQB96789.1 MAG: hypothetical protein BWX86_00571 [Verrucomicrobia bacterium ADurb.Bin122]MBP8961633.1 hypothetical protein [Opitutaceae bacterium]HNW40397.1 hypothetical protein [Opitutaceae bacterium]HOD47531.1 hypothetical protein [Opitutaceae bacterium]
MNLVRLIDFLRDRLPLVIRICWVILGLLVVIDAIPALVDKHHAHTAPEHIPGFWSVFGFLACTIIIFVSKWFGHSGIMKREDFYRE